jgi:hypothetical protein
LYDESMSRYYDYVLGLIPTALIGVTVLLSAVGVSWHAAVPTGAAIAIGVMAHAMFVRAPRPAPAAAVVDAAASASDAVGSDAPGSHAMDSKSESEPEPDAGRADSSSEHAGSGSSRYGSRTSSVASGDT